ncbi:MAG: GspE/PulE family protein [Acidimicrobiales bacterium]
MIFRRGAAAPPAVPERGGGNGAGGDVRDPVEAVVHSSDLELGRMLVQHGALTAETLHSVLVERADHGAIQLPRLSRHLVETGLVDEEALLAVQAQRFGLPVADLKQTVPEPDAIDLLPEAAARLHTAVPLRRDDDGTLEIAVADPDDDVLRDLAAAAGRSIRVVLAAPADIRHLIDSTHRVIGGVDRFVTAFESADASRATAIPRTELDQAAGDDAPIVQVVNLILTQALRDRASDVHIEPLGHRIRVRYRIDGALHDALDLPGTMAAAISSRLKIMASLNIVERRRPQDGQFHLDIDGRGVDMRLSVLATIAGEKCVIRLLDTRRSAFHLHQLGMPTDTHYTFGRIIRSPFGMVLCAGPTGSGKTTTLYAALQELDEPYRNITTIEDPVEYIFPTINQIQTNEQAGLTFATGLKSILRQDPDVILVGEIRDGETARIAVQSALTGHSVLSTLHGTDAVAALHRLLDMGVESFLIASSVLAVVGQRLVRRICRACVAPYQPNLEELAFFQEAGGDPDRKFVHGEGCNFCAGTGYQDRIGVFELLRVTPEIKRLVVGWATQEELRRLAVAQGMRTLQQEAIELVKQDVTTISEVIRSIYAL